MARSMLTALLPALLAVGCASSVSLWNGSEVSQKNGRLYVDDVPVEYHREVTLQGELDGDALLDLAAATGTIDVVGVPGTGYELVVDVYSELEGDGQVALEDGRLHAWSDQDGKVLVNGIRGRLPEGLSLEVRSGTGSVVLTSFVGDGSLELSGGTATLSVVTCDVDRIGIESGTGAVALEGSSAESLSIDSGTGDVSADGCHFADVRGESGTADFRFRNCKLGRVRIDSGTGDVVLTESAISDLETDLGTGDVLVKDGTSKP